MLMNYLRILAICVVFVCGCGKSKGPPKVAQIPVTGTVTLDGQPLADADVFFFPPEGRGAFMGRTKADGSYQLEGVAGSKAVCKGQCSVRISRMLKPDGTVAGPDEPPAMSDATESLPEKYSSQTEPTLTADVPEGGGKFDFDLKSK